MPAAEPHQLRRMHDFRIHIPARTHRLQEKGQKSSARRFLRCSCHPLDSPDILARIFRHNRHRGRNIDALLYRVPLSRIEAVQKEDGVFMDRYRDGGEPRLFRVHCKLRLQARHHRSDVGKSHTVCIGVHSYHADKRQGRRF